jgi:hypothetical protein
MAIFPRGEISVEEYCAACPSSNAEYYQLEMAQECRGHDKLFIFAMCGGWNGSMCYSGAAFRDGHVAASFPRAVTIEPLDRSPSHFDNHKKEFRR